MYFYLLRKSLDGRRWRPFYVTTKENSARSTLALELETRSLTNFSMSSLNLVKNGRVLTAIRLGKSPSVVAFLVSSPVNPFELSPFEEKCPHHECPPSICLDASNFLKCCAQSENARDTWNEFLADVQLTLSQLKPTWNEKK